MPSNHTRQSLEAMARDNPAELRRIIAGILGWKYCGDPPDPFSPDQGACWKNPAGGFLIHRLPDWLGSLDACVELWRFAVSSGFDITMCSAMTFAGTDWAILVPPDAHCIAFILAAQEAGYADARR